MQQELRSDVVPEEQDPGDQHPEEDEGAAQAKGGWELYGEPSVSPSFYHCRQCQEDILAQEVVWDRHDRPLCPQCGEVLPDPSRHL
jgi:hypothetical protein